MTKLCRRALPAILVFLIASTLWAQTQQPEIRTGYWRGMKITYQWVLGKGAVGKGKAIYQGDILLDHVAASPNDPQSQSFGIAYSQYMWPKVGSIYEIPYTIDPSSGDMTNLNTAISTFNSTFSGIIQLVAYTNQANYIDFDFDADNTSGVCEAYEGMVGGEQVVGGSGTCTVATILHELGHTVGVWHEQSRPDRNTYVNVNYGAVIKASRSNFDQIYDNQQTLSPYDYASVMEYPAFSFSRNGEPCIESIPAGIPLSNPNGYSAADIDGIERLYGAIPTQVTVTSNPPGLQVIVDGETITTPQTYAWALNSTHTLNVPAGGQTLSSTGVSYIYGRWNDSAVESHTITVAPGNNMVTQPATAPAVTVYQANFIQLVPYVNAIYPTGTGTVTPSPAPLTYSGLSGSYYIIRQLVTLTATPASGQNFYDYINSPYYLPGGIGANPKTFYVMDDGSSINLTTYFTSSPVYTVTTDPVASNVGVLVDGDFWYAPVNFALPYDSTWTASSSHSLSIDSPQYPWSSNTYFDFASWSDGGAQSHNVTLPPSGGATYSATITPNYYVDDYVLEGTCAGTISVTPGSTENGYYPAGSPITFAETPSSGLVFTGWAYDLTGTSSPQNFTVNDEVLVAADYNVNSTPLTITSLSPASATAGGAAFTLTINGTGFTNDTYVYINGAYRAVATFVSSTQVTIPLKATDIATPGAFQVAVGNFNSAGCGPYIPTTFYVLIGSGGGGGTPAATISPKSLAFASVAAGTASAEKTITLTNSGTASLSIGSIMVSGDFMQTNNCPSSLAAKAVCTVNVTFNPGSLGAITGALTFSDSATTSPQLVKMTGTGIAPLTFSPTSLTLPSVAVGSSSSATVTVTNKQTTAISLSPAASADYSVTGGSCGASLAAAGSCTITVTFAPQYKGSIKGALAITTNGAFSPQIVGLTGTATGGPTVPLTLSPASLTFASTGIGATTAAATVTVTNKSTGTLTINSISASADYAAVGSGASPCGGALAKSAKCTLAVTFTPSDTGSIKGAVAIATSGAGSPQIVGLSGTGAIPVVLAPTSIAFGDQSVGTTSAPQTVTLTNNSGGTLTISNIVGSGDFTAAPSGSTPCGATVAAASTCTFSVTFTPNVKGAITGAATVSDSAPLSPSVVKLTGTGD
ncbi:MAG TPA: choice-of-anchor D domain-containing protein [Terriglobales bacterium]|nr:choice-of-anchor D domain-containing protein [Terriglobales bacterium]